MNDVLTAIPTSAAAFAATNIDDIAVLMLLFSQVNPKFHRQHVVIGQYLGFAALVLASLLGFFGGLVLPHHWLGLLGLIPISMGLSHWFDRNDTEPKEDSSVLLTESEPSFLAGQSQWLQFLGPQSLSVAGITIANGSDNIGIYTPLFARSSMAELAVTIGIFLLLVGVWCYLADRLAHQPQLAAWLSQGGQVLVPLVLIGLGVYIILESGAMTPAVLAASCVCLMGLIWRPQRVSEIPEHHE